MSDLERIDWNLVPALDALLRERNVSRAARMLGISQSAASGALARLRRHFDDELLIRSGNAYELTDKAQRLAPLAHAAVGSAQTALTAYKLFDPSTSTREFLVASTEYGQSIMGADLSARVRAAAPEARLTFRWPANAGSSPSDWLSVVDGWLGPRDAIPEMQSTGLVSDRWVCVVDVANTEVPVELTIDDVSQHSWVIPTRPVHGDLPWRQRLSAYGVELPIAVTTESFSAVPFLVAGTSFIGVVQERLAVRLRPAAGIRILPCPWSMVPLNLTFWWHESRKHDAAHGWLREQIAASMAALDPPVGPRT